MSAPRIGSLFSGYGGLDMGVIAALGGSVAWHVEFDKAPSKILAHHWETDQALICGHSDVFSATFPTSGMTRAGTAYALPTSAHPTDGSGCSSLLPTPTAQLAVNGGSQHPDKRRGGVTAPR